MQKSKEGHGENWTHFVYKLDNLFRSIRVSDENSSVTLVLQCFLNLFELQTFLRSVCSIQSNVINSNTFWHHLLFFGHLPNCLECQMTVKFKITTKWILKMLKVGMVSSFHLHSMCERVERVTAKTGRTSCTNWRISFGVSGFRTRTHLLHGHFNVF